MGVYAHSIGNKCGRSFLRTRSQIPSDKKDQEQLFRALLLVRLAPRQPAIRIRTAKTSKMEVGSGKGWIRKRYGRIEGQVMGAVNGCCVLGARPDHQPPKEYD